MKYSEMNKQQQQAFRNVAYCADYIVDELTLQADEGEEFAIELLNNHDKLVQYIYEEAVNNVYTPEGTVYYSTAILKNIRFTGKEFLTAVASHRLKGMNL